MNEAPWLFLITAKVAPDEESAFNEWYDKLHMPAILQCPGVQSARRFVADGPQGRLYMAEYELENPEALQTPEFAEAARTTPFSGQAEFQPTLYRALP